jgi:hypothetical protein
MRKADDFKFMRVNQKSLGSNAASLKPQDTAVLVQQAARELLEFLDPVGLLNSPAGPQQPLLILSFDEGHMLVDTLLGRGTLFLELVHTLHLVADLPIYSLFLSTAAKFHLFPSPQILSDPSL